MTVGLHTYECVIYLEFDIHYHLKTNMTAIEYLHRDIICWHPNLSNHMKQHTAYYYLKGRKGIKKHEGLGQNPWRRRRVNENKHKES